MLTASSIKRNIAVNYVSQIYVTLIGIVLVPMYVRYMGAEAYGLVGFFAMLQVWFQLLDLGLTPTMARESARFAGGATDAATLRGLFHALEGMFFATAIAGAVSLVAFSGPIATSWLKVELLPLEQVQQSVALMAVSIALRCAGGLYRGAVAGFERLVWLSGFNIAAATARFVLVIPFFVLVGTSPTHFFAYQAVVAVLELLVLMTKARGLLPPCTGSRKRFEWAPLRGVLRFSLSIAFTGSVWVLVTQADKLLLSKLLPLSEYAVFTLAVLVASGVGVISGPISGAVLPRLTRLTAEGKTEEMMRLYRAATQFVAVIAIPVALVLAAFATPVLYIWTGDAALATRGGPVLALYALGNGILALAAFPYYLQYANGEMRMHRQGSMLFVLLLVPALVVATWRYGVVGAGFAWLFANGTYFLVWVPRVHRRFAPGLHMTWLRDDIAAIALPPTVVVALGYFLVSWPTSRPAALLLLALMSLAASAAALAASSTVRSAVLRKWRARFIEKEST